MLVGDLVDGTVDQLKFAAEPLNDINPPRGKYFVSGVEKLPPRVFLERKATAQNFVKNIAQIKFKAGETGQKKWD